nr:legumain-like [Penaeus vannamei]XP_027236602.1 legumain-like [Penaeus vannamei]
MWRSALFLLTVALARGSSAAGHRGDLWAVLVAGSSSWMNYRHQADVCHAYQILHQHGVPDDHIIVMMVDDIAHNEENPTPGVIINRPGGPDVYKGVPKDYTGDDVTPENFLKVLSGDVEGMKGVGSGKVVRSGPNDRIFLNMVDHGAPGIFAFPYDYLNATNLTDTIIGMHRDQKFGEMVMYVESCESGSLFHNLLPKDIMVYALSASSPNQHSYACYLDTDRDTYLGDVFSIKWMEDTDRENLHHETLKKQFKLVRKEVTTSTVMHWGEIRLDRQHLSKFMGKRQASRSQQDVYLPIRGEDDPCLESAVPSPDVPVAILKSRIRRAKEVAEVDALKEELRHLRMNRVIVKVAMTRIISHVAGGAPRMASLLVASGNHTITRWPCYTASVRAFHDHCFHLAKNPYALRVLKPVISMCEHGYKAEDFTALPSSYVTRPASGHRVKERKRGEGNRRMRER